MQQETSLAKLPSLIDQILKNRNLTEASQVEELFSSSLQGMANPFLLQDMDKAVHRLTEAYQKQEHILIYGDFDLDGTPGVALLYEGLQLLGFKNLSYYQPKRLSEGYGLHASVIEKKAELGVTLVLTVDVGITAVEAVDRANALGVDVILTDHHLPAATLPNAYAIVNPNSGQCASGLTYLCGTGVAFYLILALKKYFVDHKLLQKEFNAKQLLDLFAIATLTDLVPLVKENRVLVKHGLRQLAKTNRVGLRELLKGLKMWGRPLTCQDVAIRFAPKLNALSRMEKELLPLDIFLEQDEAVAKSKIERVLELQEQRVNLQKDAEQDVRLKELSTSENQNFVWQWSEDYHQGVVGLVASRLSEESAKPAFIACQKGESLVGSARIPRGVELNLVKALTHAQGALVKFGGHAAAAGFELETSQAEEFKKLLTDFFSMEQNQLKPSEQVESDALTQNVGEIDPQFMKWYAAMAPFGQGFSVPLIRVRNYTVKAVKRLKELHLKFNVVTGREDLGAIWFAVSQQDEELLLSGEKDLLVEPQWNYFAGRQTIQLMVKGLVDQT